MTRLFRSAPLALPMLAVASLLAAQGRPARSGARAPARGAAAANPAAAREAAAQTITEADIHNTIFTLADDSMLGRPTPSPQLEETARYVASRFQSFGLVPGGDSGTWFQRYPITRSAIDSSSYAMVMGNGAHGHWLFGKDAMMGNGGQTPPTPVNGPVVLVWGMPSDTAHPFGDVNVRGAIVLFVQPQINSRAGFQAVNQLVAAGRAAGVVAWISLTDRGTAAFQGAAQAQLRVNMNGQLGGITPTGPIMPAVLVRDSAAAGVLAAAGAESPATMRASGQSGVRALSGFTGEVNIKHNDAEPTSAPNVIGVLPGSDPVLRNQYVFFTGHMDHVGAVGPGRVNVGCRAQGADSICNGADDDASGTTTVIELAKAFASMNPHPRRTLVFMTVSGEERGLWGSTYYSEHPLFPLDSTVADLNTDMVGRYYNNQVGWKDTIVAIGKEHSDLGAAANRIVAAHPDLHMNLIDDIWPSENFYFRSDHYNFARKGVPILFFFNGTHPDYHQVSDSPDKIDTEKMVRIARMVFYLGLDVANTDARPQWNPDSRRRIVETTTR